MIQPVLLTPEEREAHRVERVRYARTRRCGLCGRKLCPQRVPSDIVGGEVVHFHVGCWDDWRDLVEAIGDRIEAARVLQASQAKEAS